MAPHRHKKNAFSERAGIINEGEWADRRGTDLEHFELRRECQGMWHMQVAEIDMMRHELMKHFGIEDYKDR